MEVRMHTTSTLNPNQKAPIRAWTLAVALMLATITPSAAQSYGQLPPARYTQYGSNVKQPSLKERITNTVSKDSLRNSLPPTVLDSFVLQSGRDEKIYGDEGYMGPPEEQDFKPENRINAGFDLKTFAGLTTGHGDMMPSAWGFDYEKSWSGPFFIEEEIIRTPPGAEKPVKNAQNQIDFDSAAPSAWPDF